MTKTSGSEAHVVFVCIFCGDQVRPVARSVSRCRCGEIRVYDGTLVAQGTLDAPPS